YRPHAGPTGSALRVSWAGHYRRDRRRRPRPFPRCFGRKGDGLRATKNRRRARRREARSCEFDSPFKRNRKDRSLADSVLPFNQAQILADHSESVKATTVLPRLKSSWVLPP